MGVMSLGATHWEAIGARMAESYFSAPVRQGWSGRMVRDTSKTFYRQYAGHSIRHEKIANGFQEWADAISKARH